MKRRKPERDNVILIGIMGTGKDAIGRHLVDTEALADQDVADKI